MPTASRCQLGHNFDRRRPALDCPAGETQRRLGGYMMALVVGLVSIALVWLIVIYGSIYLNKNVQ
jgi:hypothetical protein